MIIGIDASRANREKKTGVEWYSWHLIQAFKRMIPQDHRVVLYSDEPLQGELAVLPPNWESQVLSWPPKRLWTQVRLSYEMLVCPPDVLFVPSHVVPFMHPKKTVSTIHDIAALRFPKSYSRCQKWYTLRSARYAVRHLWRVIVPSQFVKNELAALASNMSYIIYHISHIVVVPHGYDARYGAVFSQEEVDRVFKKYNLQKPFLLSVGRLEERKNTRRLVESFNRIRSTLNAKGSTLVLVGSPGHGYEKIQDAIAESPFKDRIRLLGWIAPDDLAVLMRAAAVFVFPSLSEGFGIPVLEAFAAGTPVVAGRSPLPALALASAGRLPWVVGALEEVGGDAALFVDPTSAGEIAAAIARMLTDTSYRDQLVQKGLERVKQFSWEKSARETFDILTDTPHCGIINKKSPETDMV